MVNPCEKCGESAEHIIHPSERFLCKSCGNYNNLCVHRQVMPDWAGHISRRSQRLSDVSTRLIPTAPSERVEPTAPPLPEGQSDNESGSHGDDETIISELLCFITNKINIMPYDILAKLCSDFYNIDDINTAKDILYRTAFTRRDAPRLVKRRGDNQKIQSIHDMLNIFLEMPTYAIPCYVSKDLNKLPPLSMNNFDLGGVIKSIECLKLEMQIMKDTQAATVKSQVDLSRHVNEHVKGVISHQTTPKAPHTPRDTSRSSPVRHAVASPPEHHTSIFSDEEAASGDDDTDNSDLVRLARIQGLTVATPQRKPRYSDVTRNNKLHGTARSTDHRPTSPDTHRNTSVNRSREQGVVVGNGSGFQIRASRKSPDRSTLSSRRCTGVFVTRLDRSTTHSDIQRHIQRETGLHVTCQPLATKYDTYRSFHVQAPQRDHQKLLSPGLWPKGIIVRPFNE